MTRPPAGRLVALLAALLLGLSLILARLTVLQVREAEAYADLALEQRLRHVPLSAARGAILDRSGEDLALSVDAAAVYADPRYVRDPVGTARRLAQILELPARELREQLEGDGSFAYLARQVDRQVATRVDRLSLPGIGLLEESKRHYPAGGMVAPQVVGFVGLDGNGLSGLEYQYEELLSGTPGERVVEIDPQGRLIPQGVNRESAPAPGDSVVTTIDKSLQYRTQLALEDAVRRNQAKGGTVIVLDPHTGDILAMATYPWFDPGDLSGLTQQALTSRARNRAVTDVYEPGSVNKVITAAAALEEGLMSPGDILYVPDRLQVADKEFEDAHPHPRYGMTLGDILAQSSNVGAIRIAEQLGEARMAQYLARFGFGQRSGTGFPGESAGILPPLHEWSGTSLASISIGTGIAVTPLQMASVYATIASGGTWVEPRLVRGTVDPSGEFRPAPAGESRRVISEATARAVTRMLALAVRAGTGTRADIPGYALAGKTGTARKPFAHRGGYSDRFVASFMGFLPASSPEVVIGVILDEPETVYGGLSAAPLFRAVARHAIGRLRIAPGHPIALAPHTLGFSS
jgi:cell division protein FtsI (penicillin-binding protein 3)